MNALSDPLAIGIFLFTVFMVVGLVASQRERKMELTAKNMRTPDSDEVLTESVIRASRSLGLPDLALARTLGLEEAEIVRMANGDRVIDATSPMGEAALRLVRLSLALDTLVGSDEEARTAWVHSHNEAFGTTPLQYIQSPEGLAATLSYLDRMSATA